MVKNVKKKKSEQKKKENSDSSDKYSKNLLYVFTFFGISSMLIFLYLTIPIIFNNNFQGEMRNIVLLIILIGFVIFWGFISLFSSFESYNKDALLLALLITPLFLLFRFQEKLIWTSIFTIWIISVIIIYPFYLKDNWKPNKARGWFTLLIMLFILFGGIMLINESYGYKPISAYLNVNGNSQERYSLENGLECFSFREKILVGMMVNCEIDPPLNEITFAKLTFTDKLGNEEQIPLNKSLSFIAPESLFELYFEIEGIDKNGENIPISTSWKHTFYNLKENEERETNFRKYFLGLLSLIFLTIPLMMNQFRELLKPDP